MPHIRVVRAAHDRRSHTFSNYRDWRAFLAAMQAPAAYASVATALKAGHAWLTGHGVGLGARVGLASRKTLGV
jgi:hypothetical protein